MFFLFCLILSHNSWSESELFWIFEMALLFEKITNTEGAPNFTRNVVNDAIWDIRYRVLTSIMALFLEEKLCMTSIYVHSPLESSGPCYIWKLCKVLKVICNVRSKLKNGLNGQVEIKKKKSIADKIYSSLYSNSSFF